MENEAEDVKNGRAAASTELKQNGDHTAGADTNQGTSEHQQPRRPPVVVLIDDSEVDNPQEASGPQSPTDADSKQQSPVPADAQRDTVEVQESSLSVQSSFLSGQSSLALKSRKRRRRAAQVQEDARGSVLLPPNQYETILRRRAIRKLPDNNSNAPADMPAKHESTSTTKEDHPSENDVMQGYDEEYGDISLGMKLNIIAGKVIVQRLNALSDGRASPAQLTGLVQRGDVLLSVDGVSLVNLSLVGNQLTNALRPLSAPQQGTDSYKRSIKVRLASREGLKLLEKNESKTDPTTFALSPYVTYVDQLSGAPMMLEEPPTIAASTKEQVAKPKKVAEPVETAIGPATPLLSTDQRISLDVAQLRRAEQQRYLSEFFTWNDDFPKLLRASIRLLEHETDHIPMTFSQMIEHGERAMLGAKSLFYGMEDIDRGKDTRSFKTWNSTLSLRSRASARRRYVLKNVIQLESPLEEEDEELSENESVGSADEANADDLLLQLAAHDEIWRRNVLEVLQTAAKEIRAEEEHQREPEASTEAAPQSLESLLLGEQVSKMLKTKKKSYALPPKDVTSVLFDLMTNLTVTPDEISLSSSKHVAPKSVVVPFRKTKNIANDENYMFAAKFLISEAFPAWLRSFRPLPWEQRRVLWPKNRVTTGTSLASHDISDDGLTLDSGSTGYPSPSSTRKQRKDLRQQIEDLELDAESRAETCVLVTFYFTQEILPSLASSNKTIDSHVAPAQAKEAVEFVNVYGSYLKLHLALVYAAAMRADDVIDQLLALSEHDPRHREVKRELSKSGSLILYEPTMLSAILKNLHDIHKESKRDRRGDLMNICVSAYPDLRPWQVRKACTGPSLKEITSKDEEFHDMYYEYLSMLLDPSDGHDAARQDVALVTEWCELSIQRLPRFETSDERDVVAKETRRRSNFYRVASPSSSDRRCYRRDLFVLMKLSIQSNEIDLSLKLVDELLDSPVYTRDKAVLSNVLENLRMIAIDALSLGDSWALDLDTTVLGKIFHLFEKMATNKSVLCRESIEVSAELYSLLLRCQKEGPYPSEKEFAFVNLLAHDCSPQYALETLALWAPEYPSAANVNAILHVLLQRGAQHGVTHELSGSLLRIRDARMLSQGKRSNGRAASLEGETNVWRRMFDGSVDIQK